MKHKEIPDTPYFHFYNHNAKNIVGGGDCVVRAIGTALDMSWGQTIRELTEVGIKKGYVLNDKHTYQKYLEDKNIAKRKQLKRDDGTKYTAIEFLNYLNQNYKRLYPNVKAVIAHIGANHIICIKPVEEVDHTKKFIIYDTWDSSKYGCIGNYYIVNDN